MHLAHLSLVNFRNYARLEIELSPHITILQGDNAQGKTNFLEAIYYLSTANSPLADADYQLINWLADEDTLPFARLAGRLVRRNAPSQIEITLVKNAQPGQGPEAAIIRKAIRINGVDRRVTDLIGQMHVVLFLPRDIHLVDGSPSERRRYMNALLSQVDPRYYRLLQRYGQVVYQRNHLLRQLRDRGEDPDQLAFWDRQLVEAGAYLVACRRWLIGRLNEQLEKIHPQLTGGQERLQLVYCPGLSLDSLDRGSHQLAMPLDIAAATGEEVESIRQAYAAELAAQRREEIVRGTSLLGPHRDDLRFLVNGIDMTTYGSRGQQRTVALSTKLAEVEWLRKEIGEMPILLLDDVISELDAARRDYLLDTLDSAQQVIITATETKSYPTPFLEKATLLRVQQGRIEPLNPCQ